MTKANIVMQSHLSDLKMEIGIVNSLDEKASKELFETMRVRISFLKYLANNVRDLNSDIDVDKMYKEDFLPKFKQGIYG